MAPKTPIGRKQGQEERGREEAPGGRGKRREREEGRDERGGRKRKEEGEGKGREEEERGGSKRKEEHHQDPYESFFKNQKIGRRLIFFRPETSKISENAWEENFGRKFGTRSKRKIFEPRKKTLYTWLRYGEVQF